MFAPHIKIHHVGGASTSNVYASSRIEFFRSRLLFWKKVYPPYQVALLYLWNIPKLLIDRAAVISWLLLGQPESWGLPNKCPKQSKS